MSLIFGSVPILVLLAIQLLLIRNVSSLNLTNVYLNHKCNNTQGKYRPGSVFENNLNQVIRNLSKFDLQKGYALDSSMQTPYRNIPPNTAFVLLQCRGDSYGPKCHSCLTTAFAGFRQRCRGIKGGIIWYDQCLLEISTYGSEDSRINYENILCMSNPKNVSGDPQGFNKKRKALIEKLIKDATKRGKDGNKGTLYAAGEASLGTKKLYAMVQCTNDLYENGCYVCQEWLTEKYNDCVDGKQGARVFGKSCNLRFELYPFLRSLKTVW